MYNIQKKRKGKQKCLPYGYNTWQGGAVKQSEFRRWLESQGVDVTNGTNHLKLRYHDKRSVMPRHPGDEIKDTLRKAILKQLGLN
ncbi:hypothetical protein CKO_01475 [Citrobacter koseri ATCC BAA-895]|uniref:Type II toxin-antitoxin system HicA family toxin n=1 Tax=Citrobacter koseri (strain ATCC BAA-895 / CDC 4225-83 / SGSC4696) TaxID=290338 RepID=A8AGJ5_CITK8|nr:hypothetical protein CKO_01475 [Citrobacter koseri ATCC BAA-895]BCL48467.1 hypothetical protein MPUCK001_22850 [Citrobacter koseri]BDG84599.1 hypothetical protein TUM13189_21590 [Citrobacter koseri]BDG89403.1 hypothetical protein TUM20903_21410 [Citrobacter koseri]